MRRVVVVGGGITGLTVAYRLLDPAHGAHFPDGLEVTLLEQRERVGGNVRTERRDGMVIDGGPDAWVAAKPHATALARELGLEDRLIGTRAENRRLYVRHAGELHVLPEGAFLAVPTRLVPFARTRLMSWTSKARMALDFALPRSRSTSDESLAHFVRRRLGREALDRLAEPLMGGIYAGDPEALSIRSTFPQLVEMEERHGSVIRGATALLRARGHGSGPPPSAFTSLRGGVGELIDALRAAVVSRGATVRTGVACARVAGPRGGPLAPRSPRLLVGVGAAGEEVLPADDVVLTTPAHEASRVLEALDGGLAVELGSIPYLSTATVALAFRRADMPHPLDAVGVIVPRVEGGRVLAVTFISSKWEGRAPADTVLLRAFLGGHRDPGALAGSDADLVVAARRELEGLLGVRAEPLLSQVFRFDRANPQPIVGHQARLARIRGRLDAHPGLHLAGAAYDGVGLPDCVRQAGEVAARIRRG